MDTKRLPLTREQFLVIVERNSFHKGCSSAVYKNIDGYVITITKDSTTYDIDFATLFGNQTPKIGKDIHDLIVAALEG